MENDFYDLMGCFWKEVNFDFKYFWVVFVVLIVLVIMFVNVLVFFVVWKDFNKNL